MIKAVYGDAVYYMLRALAATGSGTAEVLECNTILSTGQIFEKATENPLILPYCSAMYHMDINHRSFQILGKDGQVRTHTFDMLNTMPGHIQVQINLYAATQQQMTELEGTVLSFFAESKQLTITDFPGFDGSFTVSLGMNPKAETERKTLTSEDGSNGSQLYCTKVYLIANYGVVSCLPVSQAKIDADIFLQCQLVSRLNVLNKIYQICCESLEKPDNLTAEQLFYIQEAVRNIPVAREQIKQTAHIPEAYNNIEYSKFLLAVMQKNNISVQKALERIRKTRIPGDSLHPIVRKQLIREVKKAMDIEQDIQKHNETISKLRALRFEEVPPVPTQPEKDAFSDHALRFPEIYQQEREQREREAEFAKFDGFMGMHFSAPKETTLSARGQELYQNAWTEYERKKKAYYETILPDYEKRKAQWEARRTKCVENIELQLNESKRQRLPHYAEIGFIPAIFQNLGAVSRIYQQLSSTNLPIQQILRDTDPINSRLGQINSLKIALDLSSRIAELKKQIDMVTAKSYSPRPVAPVKQEVPPPVYPEIRANVPFFSKEKVAKAFWGGGSIGGYFTDHQNEVKSEEDRIRNSPEYKQQCATIDEEYRKKVTLAEEEYRRKLKQYQEVVLPPYEKGYAAWKSQHEEDLAGLNAELERLEKELTAHYEATQIVPTQYRKINALRYIHDLMSSSNYTIVQAIQNYDMAVQRQIQQERLEEERRRADAAERAAWAAEEAAERASRTPEVIYRDRDDRTSSGLAGSFMRGVRKGMREYEESKQYRDYYNTPKCQRYGLRGKRSCAGCPIAHMCKH